MIDQIPHIEPAGERNVVMLIEGLKRKHEGLGGRLVGIPVASLKQIRRVLGNTTSRFWDRS